MLFSGDPEATVAFQNSQKALTTEPVLRMPDFTLCFVIEDDASGFDIGAVLSSKAIR